LKRKSLLWLLVSIFTLSVAFAGCGGTDSEDASAEKILVFAQGGDAVKLDPANITDGNSAYVTRCIIETLIDYETETTELIPGLAESWTSDEAGLVWTFKLREGVLFHDGTPFNAVAVKANFDRWMDPENALRFEGDAFEYWGYMFLIDDKSVIADVAAVDDTTLQITLSQPFAPFLSNLAMFPFGISSPDAMAEFGKDYFKNPVGTGPFTFVEWVKDDKIVLAKNAEYWGNEAGREPKLDKIIFRAIPDNSARLMELQAGSIDVMLDLNPEDAKIVEEDENLTLALRPSMNVAYLAMNMEKKPFDNVKVRQAINHAIDKEALIEAFYASQAVPAKNPMPPSLWGYNDDVVAYEYNPEKAKQLLAEAGYPDGFSTKFWVMPVSRPYMPQPKEIGTAIQQQLAAVGIKAEIYTVDWATYLEDGAFLKNELYMIGWTGDNGDPDNFIYALLDSNNTKVGSAGNYANYKSEKVHKLLLDAQKETEEAARADLYKQAQAIIHDDAPWVPLVHSTPAIALKKSVKNFYPHPTGGESTFWMVDIEN